MEKLKNLLEQARFAYTNATTAECEVSCALVRAQNARDMAILEVKKLQEACHAANEVKIISWQMIENLKVLMNCR